MKRLVIATTNRGKVREIVGAFDGLGVECVPLGDLPPLDEPVEDGAAFRDNALLKARYYCARTGCACLADDSGLEVDALDGAPGVFSARYSGAHDDAANNAKLVRELAARGLEGSAAAYRCALALVDVDGTELLTLGAFRGTVRLTPRGSGGFGYDPYFYLDSGRSVAELTLAEKERISHRGRALRKMLPLLRALVNHPDGNGDEH